MVKKRFICDRCEEEFVVEVLEPGEAVLCSDTQRLTRPFDLHQALGARAHAYDAVMTYKRLDLEDERTVSTYLRDREPGISL